MLSIAGQMSGPIRLKYFVDTHGWPGVLLANSQFFFYFYIFHFFHGQRRALQLVINKKENICLGKDTFYCVHCTH